MQALFVEALSKYVCSRCDYSHAVDILQARHNELLSQHAASERAYRSQNADLRRSLEDLQSDSKSWEERMHNMAAHWRGQAKSWQVQSEPHIMSR